MPYAIKQKRRKTDSKNKKYEDYTIARYTMDSFNFIGLANNFDSEAEAYLYLEWYKDKLEENKSQLQRWHERPQYKIVKV